MFPLARSPPSDQYMHMNMNMTCSMCHAMGRLSITHFAPEGNDALTIPFDGRPGDEAVILRGLPAPPPPSPPPSSPPPPSAGTYVHWGSRSCDNGAELLYDGFIAGSHYTQGGQGANYLCMHPNVQWPELVHSGNDDQSILYPTEYEVASSVDPNTVGHDHEAACAMCVRPSSASTYVQWGRTSCSNGHTAEYTGYVMSTTYSQAKSEFICVDSARVPAAGSSSGSQDGALLYFTEFDAVIGGSGYVTNKEVACTVCSVLEISSPYVHWGSRSCDNGAELLYDGFIAGSHYTQGGQGANYLCMHPNVQWPELVHSGNDDQSILYPTEYEVASSVDPNTVGHDHEAACAMCVRPSSASTYVQWGRTSCSNGHTAEYTGYVMSTTYSQAKSEFICVDSARVPAAGSSSGSQDGALLYFTEFDAVIGGSGYVTNKEVACTVCSVLL